MLESIYKSSFLKNIVDVTTIHVKLLSQSYQMPNSQESLAESPLLYGILI